MAQLNQNPREIGLRAKELLNCTLGARVRGTIIKSNFKSTLETRQLIQYLQQELGITDSEIALVTRTQQPSMIELPILLWNQGLIDLEKLGQIFDWMESGV